MIIDLLMVHPDHWGKGVASSLLDDIAEELGGVGVQRISLWTEIDNARSRPLYERKGYRLTGREMDHPRSGEHQVEYEKDLVAQSAVELSAV
jgi:GNAT superfamily N-acetyltransferase